MSDSDFWKQVKQQDGRQWQIYDVAWERERELQVLKVLIGIASNWRDDDGKEGRKEQTPNLDPPEIALGRGLAVVSASVYKVSLARLAGSRTTPSSAV